MVHLRLSLRKSIVISSLLAAIAAGAMVSYRLNSARIANSSNASMRGWQSISGRWNARDGVFSNGNYGRGDMIVAQHSGGTNYSIGADIRFDLLFPETHFGDAGLVIRTSDPEQGVDSYEGYYAGLRPADQTVILGRAAYEWHQLAVAHLASPISVGTWYRLNLSAQGCRLIVQVIPQNGDPETRLEHDDPACLTNGVAGLRSFYAQASWRNVKITSE